MATIAQWDINNECNLNCKHCRVSEKNDNEKMSLNEAKNLLAQCWYNGITMLNLSGGEPFLRKDIFDILDYAGKFEDIVITTNGTLLNENKCKKLSTYNNIKLSISLDGLEETHDKFRRRKGAFKKVIDTLPLLNKYNSFDEILVEDVAIEKNEDNKILNVKINSESQCKNYFTNFKRIMLSKPELAYNYLDKEYREKRFGDVGVFKKYVNDNKNELTGITVEDYLANVYEEYNEFVCKDKYGRTYVFDVKDPLNYSVKLDTNTILTDKFKTTYDSGETKEKVLLNINKWIQMLNNRDYSSAYKVLDETFRNNNFGNEDKFEEYMREKYPLHYSITFNEYNEENDVSIVAITLKDITNKDTTTKDLKIIMKLNENYDFVMSFEI